VTPIEFAELCSEIFTGASCVHPGNNEQVGEIFAQAIREAQEAARGERDREFTRARAIYESNIGALTEKTIDGMFDDLVYRLGLALGARVRDEKALEDQARARGESTPEPARERVECGTCDYGVVGPCTCPKPATPERQEPERCGDCEMVNPPPGHDCATGCGW
jgi:hypothetical protein